MTIRIKKAHPAFKHAGYSATTILPGESETEFAKLHGDLVSEWAPNGALESEVVASMAHLLWRRKNLATFRCGACPAANDANPRWIGTGDGSAEI